MSIADLVLSFPDFQAGAVIDPEEFDQNNNEIMAKTNELVSQVNDLVTMDVENVKLIGNQTIAGVKTFSSPPVVPTPTTDMQVSTKKYVDDAGVTQSSLLTTHKFSTDHDGRYYTKAQVGERDSGLATNLNTHKESTDHDGRYYPRSETDGKDLAVLNAGINNLVAHKASTDHDGRYYTETEVDAALALKAPLVSPALTGTPTAPTAAAGTNTTQIATTAFVQNEFAVTWNTPTLLNGWEDSMNALLESTPEPSGYMKDKFGIVHLKGTIYGGICSGNTIFTLPSGYRPGYNVFLPVLASDACIGDGSGQEYFAYLMISVDGSVIVTANYGNEMSLDGLSFKVA